MSASGYRGSAVTPSASSIETYASKGSEKENLAPRARFELATLRLTAECSTIELPGNGQVRSLFYNTMR